MGQFNRRRFLTHSVKASAIAATASCGVYSSTQALAATDSKSPNSRPKIAVIGCGGQGTGDGFRAMSFADIVAVCDVDTAHSARAKKRYEDHASKKGKNSHIEVYGDYRAIIDRNDIDAIVCGTVDHWHVKVSTEALRSGKHAYCEKPLTLTIEQGRVITKAVEETKKILQVGTQQRSDERFLKAVAVAHSGRLGKIKKVTVGINHNPFSKSLPTVDPPSTLNWDMWKGPTADVPYRFLKNGKSGQELVRHLGDGGIDASNCHKEFRWWLEYSGGKMTDWGAHHVDIAQWILGQCGPGEGPTSIKPVMVKAQVPFDENGNPTVTDRYNAPHRFTVHVHFPTGAIMEITSEGRNGILVEGTKGRIFVNRGTIAGKPIEDLEKNPLPGDWLEDLYRGKFTGHMQNFFECVAENKMPASDVWTHVAAINTCHLGNIAIRLNREINWDAASQTIMDDAQANAMQARPYRKGYEIES